MKLCRVVKNIYGEQQCYIVGTHYLVDPYNNYSIRKSIYDIVTLQNEYWKRPLIRTPKEYI